MIPTFGAKLWCGLGAGEVIQYYSQTKKLKFKQCHRSSAHFENGGWELGGEKMEKGQEGDQEVSLNQLK